MAIVVKGGRKNPSAPPGDGPFGKSPPAGPPKDWAKRSKYLEQLWKQNPMVDLTGADILRNTRSEDEKTEEDDEAKKRARVAAIKAANKKRRKGLGKKSNVSGEGTVSPILYSYPSSYSTEGAGTGFSLSDVPSIVWIVLAVAGGIFLIKSARKRR